MDGSCCRIKNNKLQKRRDLKKGKKAPSDWVETSQENGHITGFMPLDKHDKYHNKCLVNENGKEYIKTVVMKDGLVNIENVELSTLNDRSVELLGPKVQSNLHGFDQNCVYVHGSIQLTGYPKDFNMAELKRWFETDEKCQFFEGIVVHFSNGNCYKLHIHHLDIKRKYPSLMEMKF